METAIVESRPKQLRTKRSDEIVSKLEKKYQNEDPELRGLTNFILTVLPEDFEEARKVSFKIFFSERPPVHGADAVCRKLDDAVRFKLKVDFFILIWKESFEQKNQGDKAKLVIHELRHIGLSKEGECFVRDHYETPDGKNDFCSLPRHDLYSDNIFARIRDRLRADEHTLPA